jgi:UDP-N-acetylglucosamine 2-epimerase (non-hydrolysing)
VSRALYLVAGARPNFMKIAPIARELRARGVFDVKIVHTGQHYDRDMSDVFFEQLGIPTPDIHLGVGGGTHGVQTARVLEAFEALLLRDERAAGVVVVGDVNSTVAAALATVKLGIPLAHVEAGLRSRDRTMPEEINRVVTDAVANVSSSPRRAGGRTCCAKASRPSAST